MQKEFLNKVKDSEANQEKIRKKVRKKNEKCLKLLEDIKWCPITPNDLSKLDHLTESEILSEVRYLWQTVAPNMRETRLHYLSDQLYVLHYII